MWSDPINDEIRATRRKLAARFDNDIDKIMADVRRRQEEGKKRGRIYVRLPIQRVTPTGELLPTNDAPASLTSSPVPLPVSPLPLGQIPTDYAGS